MLVHQLARDFAEIPRAHTRGMSRDLQSAGETGGLVPQQRRLGRSAHQYQLLVGQHHHAGKGREPHPQVDESLVASIERDKDRLSINKILSASHAVRGDKKKSPFREDAEIQIRRRLREFGTARLNPGVSTGGGADPGASLAVFFSKRHNGTRRPIRSD